LAKLSTLRLALPPLERELRLEALLVAADADDGEVFPA
jgi:hypothetical protein